MRYIIVTNEGIYSTDQPIDDWEEHVFKTSVASFVFLGIETDAGKMYFNPDIIQYFKEVGP